MASSVPVNSVHSVPVRPVRTVSKVSQAQVISGHGKRQQWQKALALLERCENDGSQVPLVTFNASLGGPWRQALKPRKGPLEQSERSERLEDVVTLNQRLKALVTATAWQVSMQLMAATAALGLQLTVVSYTTGIKVVKGVSWRYATQLLAEAAGYSLADLMMYNAAMSACERYSQWQQAVMLLEEAQLNFHPDLFSFNTMISAFGKAQHWQQAVHILMNLRTLALADQISYNSAISACEKSREWCQAIWLMTLLHRQRLQPDLITYNSAISACGQGSQWQLALLLYSYSLSQLSTRPPASPASPASRAPALNLVGLNAALTACENSSAWRVALRLLVTAVTADGADVVTDVVTYGAVVSACGAAGAWQQAARLLDDAQMVMQPDVILMGAVVGAFATAAKWQGGLATLFPGQDIATANAALNGCGNAMAWRQGFSTLQHLSTMGLQADLITCNTLVSSTERATQWPVSLWLWHWMAVDMICPTRNTYNAVASACAKGFRWEKALYLLGQLKEPDVITYNVTVWSLAQCLHWPLALHLLHRAVSSSNADVKTLAAALGACEMAGKQWQTQQLLGMTQQILGPLLSKLCDQSRAGCWDADKIGAKVVHFCSIRPVFKNMEGIESQVF